MTIETALQKLHALEEALYALHHAASVLYTDGCTVAPKQSWRGRSRTLGYLAGVEYSLFATEENREVFETLLAAGDAVSPADRRKAELLKEDLDEIILTPADEYAAYQTLLSESDAVWHEAKEKSDYALFAPYLEKLVAYNRRSAERLHPDRPVYDTLLDRYEKGASIAMLDPFFALLRERLTPVILAVAEKPAPRNDFIRSVPCPVSQQRVFSDRLMAIEGLDPERCTIGETEHPFTDGSNRWDVRITTHYRESDFTDSMFSVLHEGGHALYELGVADEYQFTTLSGGVTMGIHESQSRFYENIIGRSRAFCRMILPVMRECFPGRLDGVDPETLYHAINIAGPSLIRTQADELTYSMHVLIRYEIEKALFAGEVKVGDLPAMWNDLYKSCLGLDVPDDRRGVLQDSHWAGGSFGYFPSYALGSAYGVQMLHAMEKDVDVWSAVERGDLSPVTAWLGERVHRHGRMLTPAQILHNAGVDPFDPTQYTDYLTEKYTDLYRL